MGVYRKQATVLLDHDGRLTAMSQPPVRGDPFSRVRIIAVALLLVAGVTAIAGSTLEWVTITEAPELVEGADFEDETVAPPDTDPFTGLEHGDGWAVLVAGVVVIIGASLLLVRKRSGWAWLALIGSVVIGAVAFADYRGVTELARDMDVSGEVDPGLGLALVAGAGIIGLLASAAGIAATPAEREPA
jgi:hypothetical protein